MNLASLLFRNPLLELDSVKRYSGVYTSRPDNNASHTYRVQIIGLALANKINSDLGYDRINVNRYIKKALLHDLGELVTGDIVRPIKHFSPATEEAFKGIEDLVANRFMNYGLSSDDVYHIKNDKDDSSEGILLRVADLLDVSYFTSRTVAVDNNYNFLKVACECKSYLPPLRELILKYYKDELITSVEKDVYVKIIFAAESKLNHICTNYHDLIEEYGLNERYILKRGV